MAKAVGDASSDYEYDGSTFTIRYTGEYNPYLVEPSKIQSLCRVLNDYVSPVLANYVCSQGCFESKTGDTLIGITIPCTGTDYQTCCTNVYNYLESASFLDDNVESKCIQLSCGSAYLQLSNVVCN